MLIMVTGLPGTGKTTYAKTLADSIGGRHFNTDIIRDQLNMRGQYDEASKRMIYEALFKHTQSCLKRGLPVVVDGTFFRKELREPFVDLAEELNCSIFWVEIKADEPIIKERVSQKREFSEADYEVYLKIKEAFEPIEGEHLTLQSDLLSVEEMVESTMTYYSFPK